MGDVVSSGMRVNVDDLDVESLVMAGLFGHEDK